MYGIAPLYMGMDKQRPLGIAQTGADGFRSLTQRSWESRGGECVALVISSYILAIAAAVWMLLPVAHLPATITDRGYIGAGWWVLPALAAPLVVLSVGWAGRALAVRRHRLGGLTLVWLAVVLLALSGFTFLWGPYFWPATVPLLIAAVRATVRVVRRRPA